MFVDRSSKLTRPHAPRLEFRMPSTGAVTGDNTHRRLALYEEPLLDTSSSYTVSILGRLLSVWLSHNTNQVHHIDSTYLSYDTKPHHLFNTVFISALYSHIDRTTSNRLSIRTLLTE